MRKNKCTSWQNSGYVTNCNCRESIRDEDVRHAAVSMVNFFTLPQHGRDVRVQDQIWTGRLYKCNPRFQKLRNKRKQKEEEQTKGKLFLLFYTRRVQAVGRVDVYWIRCCLNTLLMFYNILYARFKRIKKDLLADVLTTPAHKLKGMASNHATNKVKIQKRCTFSQR